MTKLIKQVHEYAQPAFRTGLVLTSVFMLAASTAYGRFTVLHHFNTTADGRNPTGGVAVSGNSVFGTARYGGANDLGTVWAFNISSGVFANLHSFSGSDGIQPRSSVIVDGNTLLGTAHGGRLGSETIWSIELDNGAFANVHEFAQSDGSGLRGSLTFANGSLFGVTHTDGGHDVGTIWQFDTAVGEFTVLYRFRIAIDGGLSDGGVSVDGDMLFGAARSGGEEGSGTVWVFDVGGAEFKKLHDFVASTDGLLPRSNIAVDGGRLYGTTEFGGANSRGTIWSLDMVNGTFATLHNFNGQTDGQNPIGSIAFDGTTLFGTTSATIWSLNTVTGSFSTLHELNSMTDGRFPRGGLVLSGNVLFGTNSVGGAHGGGTLWSFLIPEPSTTTLLALAGFCRLGYCARRKALPASNRPA